MRILKRGTRGEDVVLWQHFLMQLRTKPDVGYSLPVIRVDGIFGLQTARATRAFQQRFGLRVDGIVGRQTYDKARLLDFGKIDSGPLAPWALKLTAEPPPLIARVVPSPPPPVRDAPNTKEISFQRLRAEAWQNSGDAQAALTSAHAVFPVVEERLGHLCLRLLQRPGRGDAQGQVARVLPAGHGA
jgi:hypothetical protein